MLTSGQLKRMRRFTELGDLPRTARAEARMGLPTVAIVVVPPKPAEHLESLFPKGKGTISSRTRRTEKLSTNHPAQN